MSDRPHPEPRAGEPGPFRTSTTRAYLAPGEYADSDHPAIRSHLDAVVAAWDAVPDGAAGPGEPAGGAGAAGANGGAGPGREAAVARAIFHGVRDLPYDADDFDDLETYRASSVLAAGHGYCVSKAALLVALSRAAGIPARLLFADVRNHLAPPRLRAAMGTDVFAWHGYAEMRVGGRWVGVSPAFDPETCRRAGVAPLDFDGEHDAILQRFDGGGTMTYVKHHGAFHDVPARFLAAEMTRLYPFTRDRGISRFKAARESRGRGWGRA